MERLAWVLVLILATPSAAGLFTDGRLSTGVWDCGPFDSNKCLNEGCVPINATIDRQRRTCVVQPLTHIVEHHPTPYRMAVVGASDSGKSTFLNSLLAFTMHKKPLAEGTGKERQTTQIMRILPTDRSRLVLFDTPGFRFDNEANVEVRDALIVGVRDMQDTGVPVGQWAHEEANSVERFIYVVNVQHAVEEGALWNTISQEVVMDWAAAFDLLDTKSSYSPVLLINTYGYNPFTVARVRSAVKQYFSRIQSNAVFEMDCKQATEFELAKMFNWLLMQTLEGR